MRNGERLLLFLPAKIGLRRLYAEMCHAELLFNEGFKYRVGGVFVKLDADLGPEVIRQIV